MAKHIYTIRLSDDRTVVVSENIIQMYPVIKKTITDQNIVNVPIKSGDEIFLAYDDTEALFIVLSTDYLTPSRNPKMYMRLVKAVDYLGNEKKVNIIDET